tara:strand:- start:661 stop:1431 length:771 start_codon:yes stop_codon:yes gene_type:complete
MSSKEFTKKLIDTKFDKLVEKKGRFSYAPWATAVKQLLLVAPDSTWTFGTPMNLGETVMVSTTVTINNITRPCIMPCYATPRGGGKPTSITNPDSYELNTSYMRCLVKNIAMFGLGIDIYTQDETDEFYMEFEDDEISETQENSLPPILQQKNISEEKKRVDSIKSNSDKKLGKELLVKVYESVDKYGLNKDGFVSIVMATCKEHKFKTNITAFDHFVKSIDTLPIAVQQSLLDRANDFIQKNYDLRTEKILEETI